jgi:hypothetical protein
MADTNLGDFKAVVKSHNLCFAGFVYKQVGLITAPAGCAPRQG